MAAESPYVIVGAMLGGAKAAEALRAAGFDGPVTMIGTETERPYERPPLSKEYLLGKSERDVIFVHPLEWYADNGIDLRLGVTATSIDRATREVQLADGGLIQYAKLLLTTGASPRALPVPGASLDGVLYLRTARDSDRIKETLERVSTVAIVGGGWIGLEVAAAARAAGVAVTVVESEELPLLRVLGPEIGRVFADMHREHGVDLRLGATVTEVTGSRGHVTGLHLGDGSDVPGEAVIAAVGVTPNSQLAAAAGLAVDNGVVVDARLQSSDPDVFAAGDVANAFHPLLGKHIRVEHWANAVNQPQTAALAMLGQDVVYDRVPYFFTDQYNLSMEYSGYVEPGEYDQVVIRGDTGKLEFLAFWLDGDSRVLAGMNVNIWDVNDTIQAIVRSGQPVSADALRDANTPLDSLVKGG
jgi:3-phenylpropionate/trans-cinnamate dioxygenase ferredoxin reductase component